MKKRIVLAILVILMLTSGLVYAASVNGTFSGSPIVNVKINGETLKSDVPGVVLSGRTLLPARAIAESLEAYVKWNQTTMTAEIVKPETYMVIASEVTKDSDGYLIITAPYYIDTIGTEKSAYVAFSIKPFDYGDSEYRLQFFDPDRKLVENDSSSTSFNSKDGITGFYYYYDESYQKIGIYKIVLQIKINGEFVDIDSTSLIVE